MTPTQRTQQFHRVGRQRGTQPTRGLFMRVEPVGCRPISRRAESNRAERMRKCGGEVWHRMACEPGRGLCYREGASDCSPHHRLQRVSAAMGRRAADGRVPSGMGEGARARGRTVAPPRPAPCRRAPTTVPQRLLCRPPRRSRRPAPSPQRPFAPGMAARAPRSPNWGVLPSRPVS